MVGPGSLARHGAMGGAPPRYDVLQGYPDPLTHDERVARPMRLVESSLDVVFPDQKPPAAKRGPFKDHVERQKTAQTRKIGSCIRCRMQRIRVSASDDWSATWAWRVLAGLTPGHSAMPAPRTRGASVWGARRCPPKAWRLPCLRLKLSDVVLSKPGQVEGYEWTLRWKADTVLDDINNWASSEVKTIFVTEGYTDNKYVELQVRRFVPQRGDRLERSWVDEQGPVEVGRHPALCSRRSSSCASRVRVLHEEGISRLLQEAARAGEKLLWQTYNRALKLQRDSSLAPRERGLLTTTLQLWMSVRLTTKSCEIVGDETLGMSRDIMAEQGHLQGKIPLPPVMGAQIDSILITQIQSQLRHDTLDNLQKLTSDNKQKTWLTTYLVTFIMLHNTALLMKHDAGYARKHGMKVGLGTLTGPSARARSRGGRGAEEGGKRGREGKGKGREGGAAAAAARARAAGAPSQESSG